jgi:hypothetical protein
VPVVRTDVSEKRIVSVIRVTRIDELRTLAVTSKPAGREAYKSHVVQHHENKTYILLGLFPRAFKEKNILT